VPVRKVSNRGGNTVGRFPSLKIGRMVDYESLIECDFIYTLEFELDVTWYAEQPLSILYLYGGRERRYTPDFHVLQAGRHVIVECKPQEFVETDENRLKFEVARAWCAARGWMFRVVTDKQLRSGYRLRNIKLLTQFARYHVESEVKNRICAFVATASPPVAMADVLIAVGPQEPPSLMISILHMAFHHELVLSLDDAPITVESFVRLPPVSGKGGHV
jgi:hypothetical protein